MTTPDCLPTVMAAFLRAGHPLTLQDLRKDVGKSRATVTRWVAQLREDDWLQGHLGGGTGDHLLLNLQRPGLNAYLRWLHIETGLTLDRYERWIDEQSSPFLRTDYSHLETREASPQREELLAVAETACSDLSDEEMSPQHARAAAIEFDRACSIHGQLWGMMQRIYSGLHVERARDFIHRMGHLGDDLQTLPGFDGKRTRHQLLVIALLADYNASVLRDRYAHHVSTAAQVGSAFAEVNDDLAEWAQDHFLPGTTFHRGGIYRDTAGTGRAAQRYQIVSRINSQNLVRHGGTPRTSAAGHGGDVLVAQHLLDAAADLYRIIERIRELPAMAEVFQMPAVAARFPSGPYQEYPEDGLYQQRITGLPRDPVVFADIDGRPQDPDENTDTLEVPASGLQRGDQIITADDRPVPTHPVVLEATDGHPRVLLQGFYELEQMPTSETATYKIRRPRS